MTTSKPRLEKFITPVGVAQWPRLDEPDFRFKKDTGEYSVKLIMPARDAAPLVERLEAALEALVKQTKEDIQNSENSPAKKKQLLAKLSINPVVQMELNEETGEETGNVIFKASMPGIVTRNKGKDNETQIALNPKQFDAKGKPAPDVRVWGGSKLRVAGFIKPYYIAGTGIIGIRLALDAVQIIELVSGGNRTASDYGFETVDDGFEAPSAAPAAGESTTGTEGADF